MYDPCDKGHSPLRNHDGTDVWCAMCGCDLTPEDRMAYRPVYAEPPVLRLARAIVDGRAIKGTRLA